MGRISRIAPSVVVIACGDTDGVESEDGLKDVMLGRRGVNDVNVLYFE